jgi:hypothetical protein
MSGGYRGLTALNQSFLDVIVRLDRMIEGRAHRDVPLHLIDYRLHRKQLRKYRHSERELDKTMAGN